MSGKIFGVLAGIITVYLWLDLFGIENFGLLTAATTYVTIFSIIADFGLTLTAAKMVSEQKFEEKTVMSNLLGLRLLSAFLFMTLPLLLAPLLPEIKPLLYLIIPLTITYLLATISQIFLGIFQKRLTVGAAVWGETANRLIVLAGVLVIGLLHLPLIHAVQFFILGALAQLLIMWLAGHRLLTIKPAYNRALWQKIITQSWPIGLAIFFNLLYLKGDIFFLVMFDRPILEIGQYGTAYKVLDVCVMLPMTYMGLALPLLTSAWQKSKTDFQTTLQTSFDHLIPIAIPLSVGVALTGLPLLTAVKPELVLAGQLLWILGPTIAFVHLSAIFGHCIVAINRQRAILWGYFLVAIIALAGYIIFIPIYGAWGAAYTTLIAEALIALITALAVLRFTTIRINFKVLRKTILATLIMVTILIISPVNSPLLLLTTTIIATLAYTITQFAQGVWHYKYPQLNSPL